MTDQNHPDNDYRLPTPNMDVFGTQDTVRMAPVAPPPGVPRGTMSFQDPATSHARPPTLAEQRARLDAQEQAAELDAETEAAHQKSMARRRVMIGAGVTVGVVGVIAAAYVLAQPQTVTAQCTVTDASGPATIVSDNLCNPDYAATVGGYYSNGFVYIPIPGGGYRQYRYYYGGSGAIGHQASGGSFNAPSNATVRTGSGTTIQRGGFGITSHGGTTGGSGSDGGSTSHSGNTGNTGGAGGTGGGELSGGRSGGS
jgi:hypothetical protein